MASFRKTEYGGGNVDTSAANEELARLRRVGQYTEDIYPARTGGSGGGITSQLWGEFKKTYDGYMNDLAKDLKEIDQSYNMGLMNGAQRDSQVLDLFDYYKTQVMDVLVNPDNAIIQAKAKGAPTQASDWIESAQKSFDMIRADYGALPEPQKFRSDQSLESVDTQNDLIERKQFFKYAETKDEDGTIHKDVMGYTYDDVVVGEDGKLNKNIAQNPSVVVDMWGANGYEQKKVSDIPDDGYVFDTDPYTGGNTFYEAEAKEAESEKNLPFAARTNAKDTFVFLKGANNTPIKVRMEQNAQGRQFFYTQDQTSKQYIDGFAEPQRLGANQTMAALSGVPFQAWDAYPQKDVAKQLWAAVSRFPSDGSWVSGRDGQVYKYENGQLRKATGAILDSYRQQGSFDESIVKNVPGSFLNPSTFGPELRSFDIENNGDFTQTQGPEGMNQLPTDFQTMKNQQAQSFATGQPAQQPQNNQHLQDVLNSFVAPRFSDIRNSFTNQQTPSPEQAGPRIQQAKVPELFKGLFEQRF